MIFKAILFDFDGTLVNSMYVYEKAFNKVLRKYSKSIYFSNGKFGGTPIREILNEVFLKDNIKDKDIFLDKLSKDILILSRKLLLKENIQTFRGVKTFLKKNHKQFSFAVCSGSEKEILEKILFKLGIREYFKEVISSHEVKRQKPHPDIWLEAAKRLNVDPINCIVIEDAIAGMKGAKKAGMKVLGFVKDTSVKYPADKLFTSWKDLREYVNKV